MASWAIWQHDKIKLNSLFRRSIIQLFLVLRSKLVCTIPNEHSLWWDFTGHWPQWVGRTFVWWWPSGKLGGITPKHGHAIRPELFQQERWRTERVMGPFCVLLMQGLEGLHILQNTLSQSFFQMIFWSIIRRPEPKFILHCCAIIYDVV